MAAKVFVYNSGYFSLVITAYIFKKGLKVKSVKKAF